MSKERVTILILLALLIFSTYYYSNIINSNRKDMELLSNRAIDVELLVNKAAYVSAELGYKYGKLNLPEKELYDFLEETIGSEGKQHLQFYKEE